MGLQCVHDMDLLYFNYSVQYLYAIVAPIISDSLRVRDELTSTFVVIVRLDCPLLRGSSLTTRWYKNGVDVTTSSDPSTGRLNYYAYDGSGGVGVYQCFAKNNVGTDYATIRRLEIGTLTTYCLVNILCNFTYV